MESLLKEAVDFLHFNLTDSVLNVQIFQQPFRRDINLLEKDIKIVKQSVDFCMKMNSVQVVAPSHRLSLMLKMKLQQLNEPKYPLLKYDAQCYDILDESDSLLSQKYQLIYALGTSMPLPDGKYRWSIAEFLIKRINSQPAILDLLTEHVAIISNPNKVGQYQNIRLLQTMNEQQKKQIQNELVNCIFSEPIEELEWVNFLVQNDPTFKDKFIRVCTDPLANIHELIPVGMVSNAQQRKQILILRGFLSYGILQYSLEKRYRVDYGLDESRLMKKMAVPYRAADVPAERAEFSHPDVGIFFTIISYYHRGLTIKEYRQNISCFLRLGETAMKVHFDRWFSKSRDNLSDENQKMADDYRKVDASNKTQEGLLFQMLRKNMDFIDMYLNEFVFPIGTIQYPDSILSSAWHLADAGRVNGFSGTKDNQRMLPLMVSQKEPEILSLQATDGKMIYLLLKHSVLHVEPPSGQSDYQSLLSFAAKSNVDALIDTGSILAGISNADAAKFLQKHPDFKKQFILYYDIDDHSWMVLSVQNGNCIQRNKSPITDSQAFIIFDDSRTRGVDMKMSKDAKAILTLGCGILKDKLVQGAGRLRQLGDSQSLIIYANFEARQSIEGSCQIKESLNVNDVITWVVKNTRKSTETGLLEWAQHGLYYTNSANCLDNAIIQEDLDVEAMYAKPFQLTNVFSIVQNINSFHQGEHMTTKLIELCDGIQRTANDLGREVQILTSNVQGECEREAEQEEDKEEEAEKQLPMENPQREIDWEYTKIVSASSIQSLRRAIDIIHIAESMESKTLYPLSKIDWRKSKVFATSNFFSPIFNDINMNFLRVIDSMLIFEDGEILLLTEREADQILGIIWHESDLKYKIMTNLSYLRSFMNNYESVVPLAIGNRNIKIREFDLTILQLYNGETNYGTRESKNAVNIALKDPSSRKAMSDLVFARGKMATWLLSDLESLCRRLGYL